jgi:hypothetical protein
MFYIIKIKISNEVLAQVHLETGAVVLLLSQGRFIEIVDLPACKYKIFLM